MVVKVLRISALPSLAHQGAGLAALQLARDERYETTVVTYALRNDLFTPAVRMLNPEVVPFANPTMPRSRKGLKFFYLQILRLVALLRFSLITIWRYGQRDIDLVHVHTPMHFIIAGFFRLTGRKVVVTFHGTDFNRVCGSYLYRKLCFPYDVILCVSSHQITDLRKLFPKKVIKLVGNGVDACFFVDDDAMKSKKNLIVGVGTLRWQKGFFDLIKSLGPILADHPEWRLMIVGEGPDRPILEDCIREIGMKEQIVLTGNQDRERVVELLAQAKVFALSSVTEGLPKALLEAMAAGCACVAYDVGDVQRILANSGIVVPQKNGSLFKTALRRVIENERVSRELGAKAARVARRFDWASYLDRHYEIYQKIVSRA